MKITIRIAAFLIGIAACFFSGAVLAQVGGGGLGRMPYHTHKIADYMGPIYTDLDIIIGTTANIATPTIFMENDTGNIYSSGTLYVPTSVTSGTSTTTGDIYGGGDIWASGDLYIANLFASGNGRFVGDIWATGSLCMDGACVYGISTIGDGDFNDLGVAGDAVIDGNVDVGGYATMPVLHIGDSEFAYTSYLGTDNVVGVQTKAGLAENVAFAVSSSLDSATMSPAVVMRSDLTSGAGILGQSSMYVTVPVAYGPKAAGAAMSSGRLDDYVSDVIVGGNSSYGVLKVTAGSEGTEAFKVIAATNLPFLPGSTGSISIGNAGYDVPTTAYGDITVNGLVTADDFLTAGNATAGYFYGGAAYFTMLDVTDGMTATSTTGNAGDFYATDSYHALNAYHGEGDGDAVRARSIGDGGRAIFGVASGGNSITASFRNTSSATGTALYVLTSKDTNPGVGAQFTYSGTSDNILLTNKGITSANTANFMRFASNTAGVDTDIVTITKAGNINTSGDISGVDADFSGTGYFATDSLYIGEYTGMVSGAASTKRLKDGTVNIVAASTGAVSFSANPYANSIRSVTCTFENTDTPSDVKACGIGGDSVAGFTWYLSASATGTVHWQAIGDD